MACGTATCGSGGCSKEEEEEEEEKEKIVSSSSKDDRICFKCKVHEVAMADDQGRNINSSRLCVGCFRASLFGKFKQSVTSQNMISPTDNVLVAFSGGPASRVALQFVHEMQHKAQRNLDASRDKSYPVFGVGVAFIDESAVSSVPSHELDKAIQDMRLIVSSLAPPEKELHIVPIESICSSDSKDGRNRLKELVDTMTDDTGKEDFLHHLRILSLQKIACENGYDKLVLGSCTSSIACHVLSATVKGQGYSLPADIQYIDARWDVPVVHPLRDCLAQELTMLCCLDCLKTIDLLDCPHSGINGLVSSFIAVLREENPARERTIIRTAEKLIPFHFNRLPETTDANDHLPSRWRRKKLSLTPDESIPTEFLCPICRSPLNKSDLESIRNKLKSCEISSEIFEASCCPSCQFQILPKELASREEFYSLLPQQMMARTKDCTGRDQTWLREQIKDCLLSDGEDSN